MNDYHKLTEAMEKSQEGLYNAIRSGMFTSDDIQLIASEANKIARLCLLETNRIRLQENKQ